MSTVLLTSAGGLPQVSVIKHLRTLLEVTRIIGYDGAGYYGATASLCDGFIAELTEPPHWDVRLVCGDRDAMALDPTLATVCDKGVVLQRLYDAAIPVPAFVAGDLREKPRYGSGGQDQRQWQGVVMEDLPGRDWSCDVLGSIVVARERVRTKGASLHGIVRRSPVVERLATATATALGLAQLVNVQMREDAHGEPKVYEVNPRISGSIMLSIYAGVDLLRMEIRRQLGLDYSDLNTSPRDGATMHRYYSEAFSG